MKKIGKLQSQLLNLDEGLGTAYERYVVNYLFYDLVKKYNIKTVLEFPANGILGMPGLNSLIFAKMGCKITLINNSKKTLKDFSKLWHAFNLNANYVQSDYKKTNLKNNSYDLVYGFCTFEHFSNPEEYIKEMVRLSKKYVLLFVQNNYNPGMYLHKLQHKINGQIWDHGECKKMNAKTILNYLPTLNLKILNVSGIDMPPWPDINVKLKKSYKDYNPNKLKRQLDNRLLEKKLSDISNNKDFKGVIKLFKKWYFLIERKIPGIIKIYLAHHPYVLAIKNDYENNKNKQNEYRVGR